MKSVDTETLIIGGGITGLMCAAFLQSKGRECLLLESSNRLGGRIRTETYRQFLLDRGFQVFLTSYDQGGAFLDRSKLQLGSFSPGAYISDGKSIQFMGDPLRDFSSLLPTLGCHTASLSDKWKVWRLSMRLKQASDDQIWNATESTSIEYLKNQGFSESMIERFFRPFFGGVFLDDQLSVSSRLFEYLFKRFATGVAALPARGMEAIPKSMSQHLCRDSILLNTRVVSLDGDQVVLETGERLRAKQTVIALDQHAACDLMQDPQKPAFRSTKVYYYSTLQCALKHPAIMLNSTGHGRIQHLCFPSQAQPAYAPAGYHLVSVTLSPMEDGSFGELDADSVREEAGDLLQLGTCDWEFLKSYQVPRALPQMQSIPGPGFLRLKENLWQAGDHLSYPSINGALYSGQLVAEKLID